MRQIRIGGKTFKLPASRVARIILGLVLIAGGILGFLPILGFWMVPLGLIVLSADIVLIRKLRRRATVRLGRWVKRRWPALWARLFAR